MKRTTITLTEEQERRLAEIAQGGPLREVFEQWLAQRTPGSQLPGSEAALVRTLIDRALQNLQEEALDIGYREMAEWYNADAEATVERDVLRRRVARRWAQEDER